MWTKHPQLKLRFASPRDYTTRARQRVFSSSAQPTLKLCATVHKVLTTQNIKSFLLLSLYCENTEQVKSVLSLDTDAVRLKPAVGEKEAPEKESGTKASS